MLTRITQADPRYRAIVDKQFNKANMRAVTVEYSTPISCRSTP